MASKDELIKEVAGEIDWTQTDIKRALKDYGDFSTKEEIYACCLKLAGPELKKRNYEIGAAKRQISKNKNMIADLCEKLSDNTNFYQNEYVPSLQAVISAQAGKIQQLLRDVKSNIR